MRRYHHRPGTHVDSGRDHDRFTSDRAVGSAGTIRSGDVRVHVAVIAHAAQRAAGNLRVRRVWVGAWIDLAHLNWWWVPLDTRRRWGDLVRWLLGFVMNGVAAAVDRRVSGGACHLPSHATP